MLRKAFAFAALGLALAAGPLLPAQALAATTQAEPKDLSWSFQGPFGRFDQEQVQRGYKVYREVCSACHAMNLMYFRNLGQKGGPFYDPKYAKNPNENPVVKSLAHDMQVKDIDSDTGDTISRPAMPADKFPAPFANDVAAAASNGGKAPPDLSMMAKAREGGPNYIYSLLTGFRKPPAGLTIPEGKYYNPYFPGDLSGQWSGHGPPPEGGMIAMPPPLTPGKVTFDDGKPSTVNQEAMDVAAFLAWAAQPKMEERKAFGLGALIYLLVFSGLLYASYRRVWRNVAH